MPSIPATIVADIRARLLGGSLAPGDRLPSTRALADELGVSRGSVVSAYEQLEGEGILLASRSGSRIHPDLALTHAHQPALHFQPSRFPTTTPPSLLRPGAPLEALTGSAWRAAWRAAVAEPHAYPSPGSPCLRHLLAEHFRLTRTMSVDPEQILITAGTRDGLRAILTAIAVGTPSPVGAEHSAVVPRRLAVEDPGFGSLRAVPAAIGWETVLVETDGAGLSPAALTDLAPDAALVTPNHQFPYGLQMPAVRRRELVEWRRSTPGALLIEDDYDSELRAIHPALVALDPAGTILLGSFAKTLTPALGLGYVIVPLAYREAVEARLIPVSGIAQDALSNFLATDSLRRHTARVRREYKYRRGVFERIFPEGRTMDGGLGAIIELPADAEARVLERAARAGLAIESLGKYWSGRSGRPGVVVGLGAGSRERLAAALEQLRQMVPRPDQSS
ncbi:MocR-like pyridoxine biosynthesis transcription factor PdxR [Trueperella abortisuis]|uniref:MocR-like pyridoxine biosynthesis transcription factor PdxR n=1 Tax=Trueperella abortisuis TaxID=445930 RepID=UPI002892E764|nr:PLP-dependent aminotransferase family protein [Trueperella abortisuis]